MKKLLAYITIGFIALLSAAPITATITPAPQVAAQCDGRLLGIPPWYRGLTVSSKDCNIKMPTASGGTSADDATSKTLGGFIWTIVLNVIEMALVLAVYVAVALILYGGFLFMTGGGNPAAVEKGRKTILNAVIGLIIAMGAIAVTNFIFRIIT